VTFQLKIAEISKTIQVAEQAKKKEGKKKGRLLAPL
jgi:hypothetical protein